MLKQMLKKYSAQMQEIEFKQAELKELQNEISNWNEKAKQIQSKFNFILPNYIIDEIIINEENKDFFNLHSLINCAVFNGRISESNGQIIKQIYHLEN